VGRLCAPFFVTLPSPLPKPGFSNYPGADVSQTQNLLTSTASGPTNRVIWAFENKLFAELSNNLIDRVVQIQVLGLDNAHLLKLFDGTVVEGHGSIRGVVGSGALHKDAALLGRQDPGISVTAVR